jgi:ABC-type branched-subunit amino acid transport system substrate-binding protein
MKKSYLISLMIILISGLIWDTSVKETHSAPTNPGANTLKIGVMAPLTGPISSAGLPHSRMTQLAAEWINAKGGITIKGQKYLIELIIEDEKDTADTAITAATKLVDLHKVKFMVGTVSPTLMTAVAPITERARVLRALWHGEGSPIELNPETPFTFRVPVVPRDFALPLLRYHVKTYPNAKKITMVFIDNPAAQFLFDKTKKTAEALGLTVLALDLYPSATRDFYPLLSKVIASKPDAIYCTAAPNLMGGILKSGRELGYTGPIFNLSPSSPEVVRRIAGKDFATNCIVPAPDVTSPEMTPMIKEIRKMTLDKYKECNFDYVRQWDSFWWMMQAIEKAQSLDPSVVAKTWEKMDRIEASTGTGKMGGQQSYGINHVGVLPFGVTRMVNGELEHVGWFTPEIP